MKAELVDGSSAALRVTRSRGGSLQIEAATISLGTQFGGAGHLRLGVPDGWRSETVGPQRWRVWPRKFNPNRSALFTVAHLFPVPGEPTRIATINVQSSLDLTSTFDPQESALLVRNRASELGEYVPRRDVFDATWPKMPARIAQLLFDGLYSDVVFLSSGPKRGGLCSGMARWAIARSLGDEPQPPNREAAIERIARFHGRQLRDRALLSAAPWFLRGSPTAAFRAVRDDLLRSGMSDRALDLAVPKLWRRDVVSALVAEGHTVVPFRLRQQGTRIGGIEVYDPNHPAAVFGGEPRRITFDLLNNRYAYGTLVAMEQSDVGIIAVRQHAYSTMGSGLLATIGSLLVSPRRGLRSLFASVDPRS